MQGEFYYLVLEDKNGKKYFTSTTPVTLQKLDEHTIKYNNSKELITTILEKTHSNMKVEDIKNVKILMKKKDEYKLEKGPFYKKDAIVINKDAIMDKFELYSINRHFVSSFVKNYETIPNFKTTVTEIQSQIDSNADYFDTLYGLVNKLSKSYKGCRYIYLTMKAYDNKKKFTKIENNYNDYNVTSEEDELRYLIEHDRELLDLEDFDHYKEISPFDGTGYGRSR